ncbi:hypothetical protein H0H81_008560 [Sphagnurus paluster]|uniref:Uncharacterized protein n=1 Tax=Sphagnurus paluster TaxID=117069 RepID=A0A9P7FSJ9_9AGAR|nr:hypothetical protein H0H81_008560 [Sphagnurus paluster]
MQYSVFKIAAAIILALLTAPVLSLPSGLNGTNVLPPSGSDPMDSPRPSTDRSVRLIRTEDAAIPGSPISQAAIADGIIYVSGFLPLAPHTGNLVGKDIDSQTHAVLDNCKTVLEAAGSHLGKVVKANVFLKNITDYARVNEIYAEFFGTHRPARSAIAVADIPLGVLIEIDMIAR